MSNAAALKAGTAKATKLIEDHIINQILIPTTKDLIQDATERRVSLGHNMTGNTINSYAAGVYVRGQLVHIESKDGRIPKPLRKKLTHGNRYKRTTTYFPGTQRWDGDIQEKRFLAPVETNSTMEAERSYEFLQSYQANPQGYTLVVCNGVEYATYQENEMNIDVLTANFDYAKMFAPSIFKPLPE